MVGELLLVDRQLLLLDDPSSTNCAVIASRVRFSISASNSSSDCPSAARKASFVIPAASSWWARLWFRESISAFDDALGQRELDLREQRLEDAVARLDALLQLLHPLDPGADVAAQLVEGVELAGGLGEVVVELGQLALLDRLDRRR